MVEADGFGEVVAQVLQLAGQQAVERDDGHGGVIVQKRSTKPSNALSDDWAEG